MNRLWSRVGIRAASVGLLVAGVIGGVYLGQDREVQARSAPATTQVKLVDSRAEVEEIQLLKERQAQHAAARAYRRQAEGAAASEAMAQAKAAAGKAHTEAQKAIEKEAAEKAAKAEKGSSGSTVSYTGPIPDSCNEYSGTRKTGCALMIDAGFGIDQFPCLDKLWKRESGWNPKASNPSSGAYGIPQALPGSKMGTVADDWRTNPATQIKWGLGYIEGRYDTPCGAWSHSESTGWY